MYIYHGLVTYHTYLQMFINLFINVFVVAVKLITLVAQSDIYQLGLKNI